MLDKFKKLFKKEDAEERDSDKDLQPRQARIQVEPLHEIKFCFDEALSPDEKLSIANLSASGIGLLLPPEHRSYTKGETVQGQLLFPQARFPVHLKVAFYQTGMMGAAFIGEFSSVKSEIKRYFQGELAGLEMLEVNRDILKEEADGKPRLFRGRNNCELYLVENGDRIERFQLTFFGNYIEGGANRKTKVGFLSGHENDKMKYKGSAVVRIVSELSPEIFDVAGRLVEHIPQLKAEERRAIIAALRQHPQHPSGA